MAANFKGHIGKIKQDDYQKSMGYPTSEKFLRIRYIFFALALGALLVSLVQRLFSLPDLASVLLMLCVSFLIIGWIFAALNAIQRNKQINLDRELNGQINDEGITLWESNLESTLKWSSFVGYRISDELIILVSTMNHQVLTRSIFPTEEEWAKAKSLVPYYLSPIDNPKPYFIRLLPSLIIFVLVLVYSIYMAFRQFVFQ